MKYTLHIAGGMIAGVVITIILGFMLIIPSEPKKSDEYNIGDTLIYIPTKTKCIVGWNTHLSFRCEYIDSLGVIQKCPSIDESLYKRP